MSFINKLDRDIRDPIELLDEIEAVLKIKAAPITWPIGCYRDFKGVYHRPRTASLSSCPAMATNASRHGSSTSSIPTRPARTWATCTTISSSSWSLVQGACHEFDKDAFLRGEMTPVFFGTALGNFGVDHVLDAVVDWAPKPLARVANERTVEPVEENSQASCSRSRRTWTPSTATASPSCASARASTKGMKMRHVRIKKDLKIADALTFFSSEREMLEEAWAGDIIGLHNHGTIQIGDTFTEGEVLGFTGIPHFAPELFRRVRLKDPLKSKQLRQGLQELAEEGATQVFFPERNNDIILGAVGVLQFDVVASRLKEEYKVNAPTRQSTSGRRAGSSAATRSSRNSRTRPTRTSLSTAAATSPGPDPRQPQPDGRALAGGEVPGDARASLRQPIASR